ncbi:hypothetical protein QUA40_27750 [Microcoleus sp. Pol11C3]
MHNNLSLFSTASTDTDRDLSSRSLHDRLAISQLISAPRRLNLQGVKRRPGDIAFERACSS